MHTKRCEKQPKHAALFYAHALMQCLLQPTTMQQQAVAANGRARGRLLIAALTRWLLPGLFVQTVKAATAAAAAAAAVAGWQASHGGVCAAGWRASSRGVLPPPLMLPPTSASRSTDDGLMILKGRYWDSQLLTACMWRGEQLVEGWNTHVASSQLHSLLCRACCRCLTQCLQGRMPAAAVGLASSCLRLLPGKAAGPAWRQVGIRAAAAVLPCCCWPSLGCWARHRPCGCVHDQRMGRAVGAAAAFRLVSAAADRDDLQGIAPKQFI